MQHQKRFITHQANQKQWSDTCLIVQVAPFGKSMPVTQKKTQLSCSQQCKEKKMGQTAT
jgi:hypothetical protein